MRKIDLDTKQFTLDLYWDLDQNAPVIPASIVEIDDVTDDTDEFVVTATFPGYSEHSDVSRFVIGLDGDQLNEVQIWVYEADERKFDDLSLAGAEKGVFEALVQTHRHTLDMLRVNLAHREKPR